jgi:putative restriction endonuclease
MPLAPLDRIRLEKAALDEGFGLERPRDGDWLVFEGLGTPSALRLTQDGDQFIAATNHAGVAADLKLRWSQWEPAQLALLPPGFHAFAVPDTAPLHCLVAEIRRLARSLPNQPLRAFELATQNMGRATEAERLVVQRVGQDIFRSALLDYWGGRCAVTGVSHPALLRASHIKPWAVCETDQERLDVYNGLLLAAHIDAAFDGGLITFAADGNIQLSSHLTHADREALGLDDSLRLRRLATDHRTQLAWHREHIWKP